MCSRNDSGLAWAEEVAAEERPATARTDEEPARQPLAARVGIGIGIGIGIENEVENTVRIRSRWWQRPLKASCDSCDSWFRDLRLLDHEGHEGHEGHECAHATIPDWRGPRRSPQKRGPPRRGLTRNPPGNPSPHASVSGSASASASKTKWRTRSNPIPRNGDEDVATPAFGFSTRFAVRKQRAQTFHPESFCRLECRCLFLNPMCAPPRCRSRPQPAGGGW